MANAANFGNDWTDTQDVLDAAIGKNLEQLRGRLFTRASFFWTVNIVFMAVSVLHAGIFFGITGNGHDLPGMSGWLGFAVSFFLDLVTIILMQAMLESRYRGEENRAKQFLFFIVLCCGTSTFANLAISLNDFDAKTMLPHAPLWITIASPYVLAAFPLFVIMMSVAAEMIINVRPLESLNEEEYEADEEKRLKIIQIRNTYLQKQAEEELRALTIHAQIKASKRLRKGSMPNGFRWFWEKPVEVDAVISGVTSELKAIYEPQIADLNRRLEDIQTNSAQNPATGITARLIAQKAKEPPTSSNDVSWPFIGQKETPIPASFIPSARTQSHDEYSDEVHQTSAPISMTTSVFWISKNYPRVASEWLANNRKTATLDEIAEITGHAKRSSRNPELVLISSVIEWLKTAPMPSNNESQIEDLPRISSELHQEQDSRLDQSKETVNLDQYPELLV